MRKKIIKLCICCILLFILPFFNTISFSKYILEDTFTPIQINIDQKPKLEILSISNTNSGYETYANKTHTITLNVKITEKNITINNFNRDTIQVFVNGEIASPSMNIQLLSDINGELVYQLTLSNLTGNGILQIVFPQGIIQDSSQQKSDLLQYTTNIIIDNISPQTTCEELSIENNKSKYVIHSNESIRAHESWELSDSHCDLSYIFPSPIYYPITIMDYAGNTSQVFVDVKNAKNILLNYANYTGIGLVTFTNSGDISGKDEILNSYLNKTELLFTYLEGDIDPSSLQVRAFDYTYWGENTSAICGTTERPFYYGYNPSSTTWYDINSRNCVMIYKNLCIQLGGNGHNWANKTCLGTYTPIPPEIAEQYLYGLSGVAFQLKDSPEYSLIYQIYVPEIGWIRSASDGEETTYSHDKPFSAIRMNIVPKSEKDAVLKYWNTFIGTNRIN